MRLCVNCKYYQKDDNIISCGKNHWIVTEEHKARSFNPMIFECFDYEGTNKSSNFEDDHLFDVFLTISR